MSLNYNYQGYLQVISKVEVVMNWLYVNVLTQHALLHVLNSTWSAECAEFANIVIQFAIGNYYPITCLLFNYSSYLEVKLQLQITVFEKL